MSFPPRILLQIYFIIKASIIENVQKNVEIGKIQNEGMFNIYYITKRVLH